MLGVGYGISFGTSSQGSAMASGVIAAIGVGICAVAIAVARKNHLLTSLVVRWVLGPLGLATAAFMAETIVAGIVFSPNGTVTGLAIGYDIIEALFAMSFGCFGNTAWGRFVKLSLPAQVATSGGHSTPPVSEATSAEAFVPAGGVSRPVGRCCSSCGDLLLDRARFRSSCGRPRGAGSPPSYVAEATHNPWPGTGHMPRAKAEATNALPICT